MSPLQTPTGAIYHGAFEPKYRRLILCVYPNDRVD
jgi:hypothetical protein